MKRSSLGEAFDAPGYLRISYATSMEQLREGATRILRFAESIRTADDAALLKRKPPDTLQGSDAEK